MDMWSLWLAAAPVAGTIILLAPLLGSIRLRNRLVWISAVALLLLSSSMASQCSARSAAIDEVESRLFPTPESSVAVYDIQSKSWLEIGAGPEVTLPPEVRVISSATRNRQASRGAGLASLTDAGPYRIRLEGSEQDVALLEQALEALAATRYGQVALGDTLQRDDVTVTLSDEIGLVLPSGEVLTTGGTAVTAGKKIILSRAQYATKGTEVLAAMLGHELTHVAQNAVAGTAWWQWPWTTVDRETTAHIVQALVWAELRGLQRDAEQDRNLRNALDREHLQEQIRLNPAYPWWLAPKLTC